MVLDEERVIDPSDYGCTCNSLALDDFVLVGKKKLAEMSEMLEWCRANALIDEVGK